MSYFHATFLENIPKDKNTYHFRIGVAQPHRRPGFTKTLRRNRVTPIVSVCATQQSNH
jgi:hypothetical protein